MNPRAIKVFVCFLVFTALAAGMLLRVRSSYTLGKPGVKLGNIPIYDTDSNLVAKVSVKLPEEALACSSQAAPVHPTELDMLPPDTVYGRRTYISPNGIYTALSVVLMGTDRTSIHKPQYCLQGQGWKIEHSEVITVPIERPHPYDLKVMKLSLSKEYRQEDGTFAPLKGFYLYWFVADGQLTPHHFERMWWMGRDLLTKGLLQRWAYVAYLSACLPGQEEQLLEQMKRFVAATVPEFQITTGPRRAAAGSEGGEIPLAKAEAP